MYQRIMAFLAGPISIAAGIAATAFVKYVGPFTGGALGKSEVAQAIVYAVTFGVGAAVTALLHYKWFSNLAKYWATFMSDVDVKGNPVPPAPAPKVVRRPTRLRKTDDPSAA